MPSVSIYEKNAALLERVRDGDRDAEAELIRDNGGLVRKIAVRFLDRGTELDDLIQIGTIGMLKAIRSFSPERGTTFSTYAVPLIVGEIKRHLRDDGPVKVGRACKRLGVALLHEKNRILSEEGRDAGIEELAACCGIGREEAAIALDAVSPVASLSDEAFGEDSSAYEEILPDADSLRESERICDRVALAQSIGKLPPEWRKIILLRYYRNLTQQQTADLLGMTQVKISREEKKILDFLRKELI